jgi:epoxyqueuosine reductase
MLNDFSIADSGRQALLNTAALTARIREAALRLGFFKVGIVPAGPVPFAGHLDTWLDQGMHGDMRYMEYQAHKRRNPRLVLDKVRSILILAMNYHAGELLSQDTMRGQISRYAWGSDYHPVIAKKLNALQKFLAMQIPSISSLGYVDSGPVMEKVWGAQSELGWMGKHSNLITREMGSWFFIGILLLDAALAGDRRERNFCGTCTRCLSACPTGAIVAPYVVDARLCISYLTIEHKGSIPRALRPLIGNRIFGCDDCQEVCPWNRFARPTAELCFHPLPENLMPELAPLAKLTSAEFNARFKGTAIRRTGRDRFVRNVVVALGNSRAESVLPLLAGALIDSSPLVRAHAAWALGELPGDASRKLLESARTHEKDPEVLGEISIAINNPTSRTAP